MRQKRAKAYRKLMSLYSLSFGFRQPYQVLVDSEMCKAAVIQKLDFAKQLGVVLQGEVKPSELLTPFFQEGISLTEYDGESRMLVITQCCIHELYLQGKSQQPAVDLAKTFERRKCNHREAIPGDECLSSVVIVNETNKHRYVVATQSTPLRSKLRNTPAIPIIHINRSVMILEPPSEATFKAKKALENDALGPSASEKSKIASQEQPAEEPRKKKMKGPKGPNPLSVKKKKPKDPTAAKDSVNAGEKRRREDEDDHTRTANEGVTSEHTGHKRKRRRKAKTEAAPASGE